MVDGWVKGGCWGCETGRFIGCGVVIVGIGRAGAWGAASGIRRFDLELEVSVGKANKNWFYLEDDEAVTTVVVASGFEPALVLTLCWVDVRGGTARSSERTFRLRGEVSSSKN